jgi:BON domain
MTAVKSRRFLVLAATVGLWLMHAIPALAQPQVPSHLALNPGQPAPSAGYVAANQMLANTIAAQLRQSGQLHLYSVDIRVEGGAVELTGRVADQPQREEVLRIVQGVPGVERVRDALEVVEAAVRPANATTQFVVPEPRPLPKEGGEGTVPAPAPAPEPSSAPPAEPIPIFRAPPGMGQGPPPPMPPYAWPTFAPYNNYSRVGYPTLYPYEAWPYIGPFYPFPKVPLGWRKVQLKWEDGKWWYGRFATAHDYWRVRFW